MTRESEQISTLEDRILGSLVGGMIGDAMGAPGEGKTYLEILQQFGPAGITTFSGVGTDDTAIREQLIDAILRTEDHVSCDSFAESFQRFRRQNYGKWWVPVLNAFHKLDSKVVLPVDAGWGNAPSSSSAMAISPMGIVNAANPRQAALETFGVAGVLHGGSSGFCRDAACAMAAAVAEALSPDSSLAGIVSAATGHLPPVSAQVIIDCIGGARRLAREAGGYEAFRARFYETSLREEQCDSRETVPVALALFEMLGDDPEQAIIKAANFGRDADTIATMVGGLCGAFNGAGGLPAHWRSRVQPEAATRYEELARQLTAVVARRSAAAEAQVQRINAML